VRFLDNSFSITASYVLDVSNRDSAVSIRVGCKEPGELTQ
jgi:hypothetical protein